MKNGEILYIQPKEVDSGRDWGKTLSPAKRAVVIAHANRWSDAPPPSRYTQLVIVPHTIHLLCDEMTRKLQTSFPVTQVFAEDGHEIRDVAECRDGHHVYPVAAGLKLREVDFSRLSPVRVWNLYACRVNYGMPDPNFDKPVLVAVRMAPWLPEDEQFVLILEEITRRLELSSMPKKIWRVDETQAPPMAYPITKVGQIEQNQVYHMVDITAERDE